MNPNFWNKAQDWESDWWGDCINTLNEEQKQIVYAEKMGLEWVRTPKTPYTLPTGPIHILDVGSGPTSLLLKATGWASAWATDPLMDEYPEWVRSRYYERFINVAAVSGEELLDWADEEYKDFVVWDEIWCYNVLQHVMDPEKIVSNMLELGKLVRVFEWVDTGTNIGHPHNLSAAELNGWFKGDGKVEYLNQRGLVGKAYFGVFPSRHWQS